MNGSLEGVGAGGGGGGRLCLRAGRRAAQREAQQQESSGATHPRGSGRVKERLQAAGVPGELIAVREEAGVHGRRLGGFLYPGRDSRGTVSIPAATSAGSGECEV